MSDRRFELRFDEDAYKEYQRLDNSVAKIVDDFFDELELRADEIGKDLVNKQSTRLHGCKEIKLKKAGIRIVYRVTNETVDILRIVYVLSIEKRDDGFVFRVADKRFKRLKSSKDIRVHLAKSRNRRGHRGASPCSDKPRHK